MINPNKNTKVIPGFPNYRITPNGQIWSGTKYKWIKPCENKKGYLCVTIVGQRRLFCKVHRLVLETYVGPCPVGMETRHLNGNKQDNRLENLCWGTHQENMRDTIVHGISGSPKGELAGKSKLCREQVKVIFHAYHDGIGTLKELAHAFSVHLGTIHLIVRKKTWGHLWD